MTPTSTRPQAGSSLTLDARSLRLLLAQLDQDQADLERARDLLRQGQELSPVAPREAFELVHRAALRGAGVLVARANRGRRRRLPLNVWTAMSRLGPEEAARAEQLGPLVTERMRLDRDAGTLPDPDLLQRHIEGTATHLEQIAQQLLDGLPAHVADLTVAD